MIPTTVLDPEGREVETLVEPEAARIESAYLAGRDPDSRRREANRIKAAACVLRAQAWELITLADGIDPDVKDREASVASDRRIAAGHRETAEAYRRLAEGH